MLNFIAALVVALIWVFTFICFAIEEKKAAFFMVLLYALSLYGCIKNPTLVNERKYDNEQREIEEAACRTPIKVASANGVELWKYMENCSDRYPVYFSKSGTHTEECHTESSGKNHRTVCNKFEVPNGESN